jgi:outer membrane protein assembly factor BamB
MRAFGFATLFAVALLAPARADGDQAPDLLDAWPHWRGPLATGEAPRADPPLTWDEKTNVRWKVKLPGRGSSTPIVLGDRVFVLAAADTGRKAAPDDLPKQDPRFERKTSPPSTYHQFLVLCLDRATGKERWRKVAAEAVPHEGHHPTHSYAAGSPVTDGRRLYVSFGSRGVFCYDLDGKLIWQRDLGVMWTRLAWGEASTPAVHGDTVVVVRDHEGQSGIVALDARTGKTRWQKDRDEPTAWSTPLIVEHGGRAQVIVNATNKSRAYDLETGEIVWQCGGHTVNTIPSPVVHDGLAICVSGYRGSLAWAVPLASKGEMTGKETWKHGRGTPYVPSPLLAGGRLWFTSTNTSVLTILEARTGKVVLDRERLPNVSSFYASPVAAKGRVYFVGRDGTTLVVRQDAKAEPLAVNRLDDQTDASPALAGRQLFLRGHGHLYCLEARD